MAEGGVELGHALCVRQRLQATEQHAQQRLLHQRVVAALDLFELAFDQGQVARLVAALAAFVRLDRFDPQPFQLQGRTQQLGLGEQRQQQVALAHRRGLGQQPAHRLDIAACGRLGGRQHRLLVGPAQSHRVAAQQSFQFAGGALAVVLQRLHLGGVAGGGVGIAGAAAFNRRQQLVEDLHPRRQRPSGLFAEFVGAAVAEGGARVAGEHGEVAFARPVAGHLQVRGVPVGHVVGRIGGRLAVAADVGTQQGEVAGVARPHEVVDLVAEVADAARRRVDQAQVAQLQLADPEEIGAVVHVGHAAADPGLALAFGDDALAGRIDRVEVGAAAHAARIAQHLVGDPVETHRHQHPEVRIGRQLGAAVGGDVAVLDQVALGGAVVLDHAVGDVVVGQDQAVGGDEGAGAAAGAHHRVQRRAGEVGQRGRIAGIAGLAQPLGDLRQLRGHPHAFVGVCGGRQCRQAGQCKGGSTGRRGQEHQGSSIGGTNGRR